MAHWLEKRYAKCYNHMLIVKSDDNI